uniref:hypothetical protein n=1 Tax=Clostridium sp. NkU-1 TaxID=1095009 RepID=UPI0006D134F6
MLLKIETERLTIRELLLNNHLAYIEMASDGSLSDVFGDYTEWAKWLIFLFAQMLRDPNSLKLPMPEAGWHGCPKEVKLKGINENI